MVGSQDYLTPIPTIQKTLNQLYDLLIPCWNHSFNFVINLVDILHDSCQVEPDSTTIDLTHHNKVSFILDMDNYVLKKRRNNIRYKEDAYYVSIRMFKT